MKTIIINKEIGEIKKYERNQAKNICFLAIVLLGFLITMMGNYPSNIVSVILLYPIYYWGKQFYINVQNRDIVYCDLCRKAILKGISHRNIDYCNSCLIELDNNIKHLHTHVNFTKIEYEVNQFQSVYSSNVQG